MNYDEKLLTLILLALSIQTFAQLVIAIDGRPWQIDLKREIGELRCISRTGSKATIEIVIVF